MDGIAYRLLIVGPQSTGSGPHVLITFVLGNERNVPKLTLCAPKASFEFHESVTSVHASAQVHRLAAALSCPSRALYDEQSRRLVRAASVVARA